MKPRDLSKASALLARGSRRAVVRVAIALVGLTMAWILAVPASAPAGSGSPVAANVDWDDVVGDAGLLHAPGYVSPLGSVTVTSASFSEYPSSDGNDEGSGLAIGSDGKLYGWGDDEIGQLGDGKEGIALLAEGISLPGGVSPAEVSTSIGFSAVLGSNGVVYTAGDNGEGQLGDGMTGGTRDTFAAVTLPAGVSATAVAAAGSYALAVGSDGDIYAWGAEGSGQLGDGATSADTDQDTPEAVTLPAGVAATAVAASADKDEAPDSFAIGSDGRLYSWGSDSDMLGDGGTPSTRDTPGPVDLPSGVRVVSVSAGYDAAYAVTSTGKLYGWGSNYYGDLGDGTSKPSTAPELIGLPGGAAARSVFADADDDANEINLVTGTDGQIYSDGSGNVWALGYGTEGTGDAQTTFKAVALPAGFVATSAVVVPEGGFGGLGYPGGFAIGTTTNPPIVTNVAPIFTQDSPPTSLAPGSAVSYTFAANGTPTFSLAPGAPSWLSIDPATGALSGTAPSDLGLAGYSVIATNSAGATTAGPFYLVAPSATASVSGTVGASGVGVAGSIVDACAEGTSYCVQTTTDENGAFSVDLQPGLVVTLTAYPPPDSDYVSASRAAVTVPAAGLDNQDISLFLPTPPADQTLDAGDDFTGAYHTWFGGLLPVIGYSEDQPFSLTGCPNGIALVSVTGSESESSTLYSNFYALSETTPGSGTYSGVLPAQEPIHGLADVQTWVTCPLDPDGDQSDQSNLLPSIGSADGGTTVAVTGTGLTSATQVDFGSTPATSFSVVDDDVIQAVAPPGAGTVPVTVTTPDGTQTIDDYTYQAVDSVSPNRGAGGGGTTVTITGTGLQDAEFVVFGDVPASSFTQVSDTQIQAVVAPGSAGPSDITVQTDYGTTPVSASDQYTYTSSSDSALVRANTSAGSKITANAPKSILADVKKAAVAATAQWPSRTAAALVSPSLSTSNDVLGSSLFVPGGLVSLVVGYVYKHYPAVVENLLGAHTLSELGDQADNLLEGQAKPCATSKIALAFLLEKPIGAVLYPLSEAWEPSIAFAVDAGLTASGVGAALVAPTAFFVTPVVVRFLTGYLVTKLAEVFAEKALEELMCEDPPTPNIRIDPSGTVLDTNGNPVSGATATILRSDAFAGPFTAVDPTSPGIEPAVNPEQTDTTGQFDWDVDAGFYEVQATKSGCSDPTNDTDPASTIGPSRCRRRRPAWSLRSPARTRRPHRLRPCPG